MAVLCQLVWAEEALSGEGSRPGRYSSASCETGSESRTKRRSSQGSSGWRQLTGDGCVGVPVVLACRSVEGRNVGTTWRPGLWG